MAELSGESTTKIEKEEKDEEYTREHEAAEEEPLLVVERSGYRRRYKSESPLRMRKISEKADV